MRAETDSYRSVEEAFARVLDAERDALRQVSACDSRAEQDLQKARQTVRVLAGQTQERITRLHANCARRTRQLVADMHRDAAAQSDALEARTIDRAQQVTAVQEVAAWLTEPDRDDDG
jgi:hypothetical protein